MGQISIFLFVVSLILCGYSNSLAQDKMVLPITYSAINANMLSLWVGKDAGYFDEQGLDVRMLLIRGGSLAVQLLVTGQSPIGLIGGTSAAYAYLQGNKDMVVISNIVAVATEGVHRINSVTLGLGQKEKGIVKILRVLSRHVSTVRICLLCVCVHM